MGGSPGERPKVNTSQIDVPWFYGFRRLKHGIVVGSQALFGRFNVLLCVYAGKQVPKVKIGK